MSEKLKVLDLFSGIGGFSLGLERTGGFQTIAFCEIDNYCQRVLHKHWPEVYIHSDIRTLTARHFDGYARPDVICGGFPCQDISNAGKRAGIGGERSGLWKEYIRLIAETTPKFVIIENVAALLGNGMDVVLRDLSESGYDAEWQVISAADVGAPHLRERVWIVAYPMCDGQHSPILRKFREGDGGQQAWAYRDAEISGRGALADVADAMRPRLEGQREEPCGVSAEQHDPGNDGWWKVEPNVGRVANGVPARVDRLRALGNSIVPQIAEWIGNRILATEREPNGVGTRSIVPTELETPIENRNEER